MRKFHRKILSWALLVFLAVLLLAVICIQLIQADKFQEQNPATDSANHHSNHPHHKETATMTQIPVTTLSPTPLPFLSSLDGCSAGDILEISVLDMANLQTYFTQKEVDSELLTYISGKSYQENNDISLDELAYLKLLHYNYNHQIQVGELLVNKAIATDCIQIFTELFQKEYEISSMYLIDRYWTGDGSSTDTASMNDNNCSAFCYRTIAGTSKLSNHALGYAIDINPYENPYITYRDGVEVFYHENAQNYANRSLKLPHMIHHEDLCYQLFTEYGFTWGGDWKNSKDYQHFEKKP